jgi:hypothetical protein
MTREVLTSVSLCGNRDVCKATGRQIVTILGSAATDRDRQAWVLVRRRLLRKFRAW